MRGCFLYGKRIWEASWITIACVYKWIVLELADSWSYLYVVDQIQQHGQMVNFWRLPGYPLLIWFTYALTGQGNVAAVSVVQGMLFILSVLEFYILSLLILRRAWIAFLLSLLVGTDIVLLSYVKPIMSEGVALWLLVTLALAVTLFYFTSWSKGTIGGESG